MEKHIRNKVIVITGGADGLGYDIADKYLKKEAKVVILLDINELQGAEAVNTLNNKYGSGKAVFKKCDVTSDLEVVSKKIFETYKQVDVLVNNAGIVNESSPRKVLDINAVSLIEWTMKFWEHMRKDKGGNGGTIVNMGSIYSFAVDPYLIFYKASKYAVMGFTKSLGHINNYNMSGVRVVVLCPGFTHTKLTSEQLVWEEHRDDFEEFLKTQLWQNADAVGTAAVEMFERADSGTAWMVIGGNPVEECP